MKHLLGRVGLALVVLLVVSCLPVIPIMESPVVQFPTERLAWYCLLQLVAGQFLVGMRQRAIWMTLPALIGLPVVAWITIRWLNRRVFGRDKFPSIR